MTHSQGCSSLFLFLYALAHRGWQHGKKRALSHRCGRALRAEDGSHSETGKITMTDFHRDKYCHVCKKWKGRIFFQIMSSRIRNRSTEARRRASLAGSIKHHTAVVASKIHLTVTGAKTHFIDELVLHTPHLCCPRAARAVPPLGTVLLSSPLHPTSLPHVLSEGRWIALLRDINNMSYCWSVRGKACELSIPSHWLHDWDAVPRFFSFLSLFLSLKLSTALPLFSLLFSVLSLLKLLPIPLLFPHLLPLRNKDLLKGTLFAYVFLAMKWLPWEDQGILRSLIREGVINKMEKVQHRLWGIAATK